MALINNAPAPVGDPIAQPRRPEYKDQRDPQEGLISVPWADWFKNLVDITEKFAGRAAPVVSLTAQSASIGATDMTDGTISAGLYRLNYYLYAMTEEAAATVSVTLDWQTNGNARAFTGAALDCTLPDANQEAAFLIRVEALTPVRYSTTVASGGFLTYGLDIVLEEIKA